MPAGDERRGQPPGRVSPSGGTATTFTLSTGKRELLLQPPITNAAGTLGFSSEARRVVDLSRLGAFVTNPVSLAPRSPTSGPRLLDFPGGMLLHTGHPNPGLSRVLRDHAARWAHLPCPVIVHLLSDTPQDLARMVSRLETVEAVAAVEVGLRGQDPAMDAALVEAAARGELPIIARTPLTTSPEDAAALARAGAAAISMGPPRGALPAPDGSTITGRLYGPALFPLALQSVRRWVASLQVPLLAAGGIYTAEQRLALHGAGAAAVQLDAVLWTEPETLLEAG